jgi:hypothetical protein
LPKTTLPLTKNTVAAVARVIPLEHPVANRKQSASTLPNEAKRIEVFAIGSAYGNQKTGPT